MLRTLYRIYTSQSLQIQLKLISAGSKPLQLNLQKDARTYDTKYYRVDVSHFH